MAQVKRFLTPPFVSSFPALFEASSYDGGPPKYGLSALWRTANFTEEDWKLWRAIKAGMDEVSLARFKKKVDALPGNFKKGLRDGAEKADLEGYGEGITFASLTTKMRPGVIGPQKEKIGPEHGNADLIYPGCVCRATVNPYSYDNKGKGIALGLMNVQYLGKGKRLDSRTDASQDFEEADTSWLDQDAEDFDDNTDF